MNARRLLVCLPFLVASPATAQDRPGGLLGAAARWERIAQERGVTVDALLAELEGQEANDTLSSTVRVLRDSVRLVFLWGTGDEALTPPIHVAQDTARGSVVARGVFLGYYKLSPVTVEVPSGGEYSLPFQLEFTPYAAQPDTTSTVEWFLEARAFRPDRTDSLIPQLDSSPKRLKVYPSGQDKRLIWAVAGLREDFRRGNSIIQARLGRKAEPADSISWDAWFTLEQDIAFFVPQRSGWGWLVGIAGGLMTLLTLLDRIWGWKTTRAGVRLARRCWRWLRRRGRDPLDLPGVHAIPLDAASPERSD